MFIVIEGLDGAGTTTQAAMLAQALRAEGHDVVETCEPTDGLLGTTIRQALSGRLRLPDGTPLAPETIALLFAADRVDHLRARVEPALERGAVVISDRYVHSSIAYQSVENDPAWVAEINRHARRADLVFFVDAPVDVCLARIRSRGRATDMYEKETFLRAVRRGYDAALAQRDDPCVVVDGDRTPEAVHAEILSAALEGLAASAVRP